MRESPTIAIIGAGAMGSCLGALLSAQHPVIIVCRSPHRAAQIVCDGVQVSGLIEREGRPIVVRRVEDLARFGVVDLIFVATKTTGIPEVGRDLAPVLRRLGESGSEPVVISFQNGIEPGRHLIELLGCDRVLRMVVNLGATIDRESGIARVALDHPPHRIGCLSRSLRPHAEAAALLLTEAGFQTVVDDTIEVAVWQKAIANAAANPVCALVNSTVGEVLDSPSRRIVTLLMNEAIAVARAEGLDLGPDYEEHTWRLLEEARPHTPSMVEDIRSGHESEVGQLNRQIIEHARSIGVPAPTHEIIDALIETFDFKTYLRRRRAAAAGHIEPSATGAAGLCE